MAGIDTYLEQILNARYGRDVRQSIHDALDKTYDDATAAGNANAEVAAARGTYENLKARLDASDSTISDDEDDIAANSASITTLGSRVTALEAVNVSSNTVFNTWTQAAPSWAMCTYTQSVSQGSILLFCVQDMENGHYYNAVFHYYSAGAFFVQYFTPTKCIMVEFFTTGYCQVKLDGFTSAGGGAVYKIIKLL